MKKSRKREEQLNNKPNVMLCLAFVLLFLAGVSTSLVSGLYARYTSVGTGDDAARVASFEVNAVMDSVSDSEYDMGNAPLAQYKIDLKNNSEVAVTYHITIVFDEVLPAGVKPVIGRNDGVKSVDSKVFTYENQGDLGIGEAREEFLKFIPDGNSILGNYSEETDIDWTSANAFKVNVEFDQID